MNYQSYRTSLMSRISGPSVFAGGSRPKKSTFPTQFWSRNCSVAVGQVGLLSLAVACVLAILVNVFFRIDPEVGRGLQVVSTTLAPLPIVSYFFMRHGRSASIGQASLTFTEAVLWMFPFAAVVMLADIDGRISSALGSESIKICPSFNLTDFLATEIPGDFEIPHGTPILINPEELPSYGCDAPVVHWVNFDSSMQGGFVFTIGANFTVGNICVNGTCTLRSVDEIPPLKDAIASTPLRNGTLDAIEVQLAGLRRTRDSTFVLALGSAFCEEVIKYLAVRNVVFSTRVVDPSSLLIYALSGSAGFAVVENLLYVLFLPYAAGDGLCLNILFFRMLSVVPMHLMTGVFIGCALGWRRFFRLGPKQCGFSAATILVLPIILHGLYEFILSGGFLFFDFSDTITDDSMFQISYVLFVLANMVTIVGWLIVRYLWLRLAPICVVNIRPLMNRNIVVSPLQGRCLCLDLHARCMMDPCIMFFARFWTPMSFESDNVRIPPRVVRVACKKCQATIYAHSHLESNCPYCFDTQPPTDFGCLRQSTLSTSQTRTSAAGVEMAPMDDPLLEAQFADVKPLSPAELQTNTSDADENA